MTSEKYIHQTWKHLTAGVKGLTPLPSESGGGCKKDEAKPMVPVSFSALTLLDGWQEGHLACKKNKCSAAVEMGDHARAKWAEKWGGAAVPRSVGGAGSHLTQPFFKWSPKNCNLFRKVLFWENVMLLQRRVWVSDCFSGPAHTDHPGWRVVKWVVVVFWSEWRKKTDWIARLGSSGERTLNGGRDGTVQCKLAVWVYQWICP